MRYRDIFKRTVVLFLFSCIGSLASAQWIQLGQDIFGGSNTYSFGTSVSISGDGNTLAVNHIYADSVPAYGAVNVYQLVADTWVQKGQKLVGEGPGDLFGSSLSLTPDGQYIAVGAFKHTTGDNYLSGQALIYKFESGTWVKQGEGISGQAGHDYSGVSVSLSADGQIVAIGSPFNETNGVKSGQTRVFQFAQGVWTQMGDDINGDIPYDWAGQSVGLSADGKTLIVGSLCHGYDLNYAEPGKVKVYHFISENWVQMGETIYGGAPNDALGWMVSISDDGNTIAAAAPHRYENESDRSQVEVYKWQDEGWVQKGQDILRKLNQGFPRIAISLSGNGESVAVGVSQGSSVNTVSGRVDVFGFDGTDWNQWGSSFYGAFIDYRSNEIISLNEDGSILAIGSPAENPTSLNPGKAQVFQYSPSGLNSVPGLEDVILYPNPTSGNLQIDVPGNEVGSISIYDVAGKLQKHIISKGELTVLDLSSLESGLHFIYIRSQKGMKVEKVILKK